NPGAPLPAPGEPARQEHPSRVPATRALAKPPLRKYAKDRGVNLTQVVGTGPNGVIRRPDVDAFLDARSEASEAVVSGPHQAAGRAPVGRREPIKGVRKATAAAMVASAFTAPHASEWITFDVTATMELVQRLKARREFAGAKATPLLLLAKAVCLAIRRTPELNSSWDEAAQEIVHHAGINLGIATATPRGLLVPNIKAADQLDLLELAVALKETIALAREGRCQPADLSGGTVSITNVGVFGIDGGTPILNPGEAGIVALGAISRRPWVVGTDADERIEPRWVSTLALSFDHRLADGEQASIFLADVARILADPGEALLF
ncbi:MAG TPA: dihydrolipoamide acetyltransferase family protein, partial [Dermatophilaceae bacterium]|nr:dihydrolipoamide acetyltransferase family protein [Dermatophilaceae bacterium]